MKRVLQVVGSLQRGGAETMIMNIYRAIDRNKVQFDFLVKDRVEIGYEQEVEALGGRIFCVPSARKVGIISHIQQQARIMKEYGPFAAVHSHVNVYSGLTLCAAKMAGVPVRISHSHIAKFYSSFKLFIGRALIRMFATKKLACGMDAGRALFGRDEFEVLPNAIDTAKFLPVDADTHSALAQKLGVDTGKFNICHIGRFNHQKNHEFLIDFIKAYSETDQDFMLYLLGNGELQESIEAKVKDCELTDRVVFCGSVSNPNEYLRLMDVFVLPSNFEGLPVSLVEAQCAGLHCLSSTNVTTEIDLKIGLMEYLPLEINAWVDALQHLRAGKDTSTKEHGQLPVLKERCYDIASSAQTVYNHYRIDE